MRSLIVVLSLFTVNGCTAYHRHTSAVDSLKMEIVAAGQNITSKNSVAEIKVIISNKGNKTVRVMDELEITTNKNHRCYALYVKIINHKNIQMNFALNGFDIFGHSGFKYVKLQPGDTIKTTFQINFRELFLERVGNPNLNFGTYTITVTLRDLYKNIVPEITSSPLYISYQNDVGLIVGDEGKTSEPLNKKK